MYKISFVYFTYFYEFVICLSRHLVRKKTLMHIFEMTNYTIQLIIMSFDNISFSKLAIIFIIAGVVFVLAILGSSATSLFSESITEEAEVKMKQEGNCIVEAGDRIPRMISDCSYNVNDTVLVTYKTKQPAIEKHQLK